MQGREENGRFSWLARNIAMFIAAGFEVPKGKENTALNTAQTLAFDDVEAALMGSGSNAPAPQKENSNGSYERFLGMTHSLDQRGKMI